jgi:hypothetical protein
VGPAPLTRPGPGTRRSDLQARPDSTRLLIAKIDELVAIATRNLEEIRAVTDDIEDETDGRHRSWSCISSMTLRQWKSAYVAPTANETARAAAISKPVTGRRFRRWRQRVPGRLDRSATMVRRRPSQALVGDLVVARARTLLIIHPTTGRRNLPAK